MGALGRLLGRKGVPHHVLQAGVLSDVAVRLLIGAEDGVQDVACGDREMNLGIHHTALHRVV